MAKTTQLTSKKKKTHLSNAIGLKKSKVKAEAKLNPFEIRFTKAKHKVVNRPVQVESGKPGITRALGIKKRKETLLQEYRLKDKKNIFVDRRIGEKVKNDGPDHTWKWVILKEINRSWFCWVSK